MDYFADAAILATLPGHETTDGEHGRLEIRRAWVSHDIDWLRGPNRATGEPDWLPGLASLGMIEATVTRAGKTTTCRHYHLSSRRLAAADYRAAARAHWRALKAREGVQPVYWTQGDKGGWQKAG